MNNVICLPIIYLVLSATMNYEGSQVFGVQAETMWLDKVGCPFVSKQLTIQRVQAVTTQPSDETRSFLRNLQDLFDTLR